MSSTPQIVDPVCFTDLWNREIQNVSGYRMRNRMTQKYQDMLNKILEAANKAVNPEVPPDQKIGLYSNIYVSTDHIDLSIYSNCKVVRNPAIVHRSLYDRDNYLYGNIRYQFRWTSATGSWSVSSCSWQFRTPYGYLSRNQEVLPIINMVLRMIPVSGVREIADDHPDCLPMPHF